MASALSHTVVAVALGNAYAAVHPCVFNQLPAPSPSMPRFWALSIVCALLPDLDVIGYGIGIPYGHAWGHRGLSQSLLFAAGIGLAVASLGFPDVARSSLEWWTIGAYFSVITASHGVLDAATNGGLGVAFLAPFDNTRYFLPWRPLEVPPLGIGAFFTPRGLAVLKSELAWIGLPSCVVLAALRAFQRYWHCPPQ